jgi:hypothetical protein
MSKEKAVKVRETKSTVVVRIPAYSDSKLVGWTEVTLFQETEAGLAEAKRTLTLDGLSKINRQTCTDAKNNLRRGTSALAALRQLAKTNPTLNRVIELVVKQAASGSFDINTLEAIEASLKGK